jgi:tRNA(adenine34) deaminase
MTAMTTLDRTYMDRALELAHRAEAAGEVPVGAVVVFDDQIIGEGWNQPIGAHDPSAHAEMVAMRAAAKHMKNYRLPGTTLYVTLEPCAMCVGAIIHARVARVVFGAFDPKTGAAGSVFPLLASDKFNHRVEVTGGLMEEQCGEILRNFFQSRR